MTAILEWTYSNVGVARCVRRNVFVSVSERLDADETCILRHVHTSVTN